VVVLARLWRPPAAPAGVGDPLPKRLRHCARSVPAAGGGQASEPGAAMATLVLQSLDVPTGVL